MPYKEIEIDRLSETHADWPVLKWFCLHLGELSFFVSVSFSFYSK